MMTTMMRPCDCEDLKPFLPYIMYKSVIGGKSPLEYTLEELNQCMPTWNKDACLRGLLFLCKKAQEKEVMFSVYSEEEIKADLEKEDVKIWFFPGKDKEKPLVMLIAGGAYNSVCSMVESFPTAESFHKMGFSTVVLNYRVAESTSVIQETEKPENTLKFITKCMDDIAASLTYIYGHRDIFELKNQEYMICGFSAGANLSGLWGTSQLGYQNYSMKKPEMLMMIYPPITSIKSNEEKYSFSMSPVLEIAGKIDGEYPPCFAVHCKDDEVVYWKNTLILQEQLEACQRPVRTLIGEKGGHGFGDGAGTTVEGWPLYATVFFRELYNLEKK